MSTLTSLYGPARHGRRSSAKPAVVVTRAEATARAGAFRRVGGTTAKFIGIGLLLPATLAFR